MTTTYERTPPMTTPRPAASCPAHGYLAGGVRLTDGVCEVCVANIIADVICMFAKPLIPHIVEGGLFICSGIIKEREQDVVNALNEANYTILEIRRKGEWVAILSRRPD